MALEAYPGLTGDDIYAAMGDAADTLAHDEVVFVDKDAAQTRKQHCGDAISCGYGSGARLIPRCAFR